MTTLLTTDLHLTDRPQDEYRWGLFDWITKEAPNRKLTRVVLMGDLTHFKDNHSAMFVNRVVASICRLRDRGGVFIYILKGNHDYTIADVPFFGFLDMFPGIRYFSAIESVDDLMFLPHSRDPLGEWENEFGTMERFREVLSEHRAVFMHQTLNGAVASNGQEMEGISADVFKGVKADLFSGDIHVPQKLANVVYVGSPYRIHFGDAFDPRVVWYNDGIRTDLKYPCISKRTWEITSLKDLEKMEFGAGDQVKVRFFSTRSQSSDWPALRADLTRWCGAQGIVLSGSEFKVDSEERARVKREISQRVALDEVLRRYVQREGVSDQVLQEGLEMLE